MWYEIIPSFGIIFAAMSIPAYSMYYVNKLVLGNAYRRDQLTYDARRMYRRDRVLTDNPYKVNGLETIPD